MEEKKELKKETKKLSYEELELAARQVTAQLDAALKENQRLKIAYNQAQLNNLYTELEFKFKVLNYTNLFDSAFVEQCVKSIQSVMTPSEESENKE